MYCQIHAVVGQENGWPHPIQQFLTINDSVNKDLLWNVFENLLVDDFVVVDDLLYLQIGVYARVRVYVSVCGGPLHEVMATSTRCLMTRLVVIDASPPPEFP